MNDDHQIPEERVFLYYLGNFLIVVGILMFLSVMVQGAISFNRGPSFSNPPRVTVWPSDGSGPSFPRASPFENVSRPSGPNPLVALGGMGLMFIGSILSNIGRAGLASTGIVLDPKRQREEMKPWSKMTGGMMNDALEEVDLVKSISASGREVIKVRCPQCRTLNDEDAKFCDECGKSL